MHAPATRAANPNSSLSKPSKLVEWLESPFARLNAFDTMRLFAAASVIVSHSFMVSEGSNDREPISWLSSGQSTIGGLAVGVFFVISGMFISASFERSRSLADFCVKRARRIMPALIFVTAILAFIVGPLNTTLPIIDYFSDKNTWLYFKNALFLPNAYHLPGVFQDHKITAVNGSVWTLKFEVICYAIAAASLSFGEKKKIIIGVGWIASFIIYRLKPIDSSVTGIFHYIFTTAMLFRYFGAGMVLYLFRDKIILNAQLALACLLLSCVAIFTPFFVEVTATFGAYSVIVFGYLAPSWVRNMTAKGDFSYGVYIYGWPVQQLLAPIGAGLALHWLVNSVLAVLTALGLGALSWFWIEKPALAAKTKKAT